MALVVPNDGEIALLTKTLKTALAVDQDYKLRLYKDDTVVLGPLTTAVMLDAIQADFDGYAVKTLTRAGWGTPTTNAAQEAESVYTVVQTWTCGSGTQTIYGYYVTTDEVSPQLLWAEDFSTPRALTTNDVLNLTPVFTLKSAN